MRERIKRLILRLFQSKEAGEFSGDQVAISFSGSFAADPRQTRARWRQVYGRNPSLRRAIDIREASMNVVVYGAIRTDRKGARLSIHFYNSTISGTTRLSTTAKKSDTREGEGWWAVARARFELDPTRVHLDPPPLTRGPWCVARFQCIHRVSHPFRDASLRLSRERSEELELCLQKKSSRARPCPSRTRAMLRVLAWVKHP